MPGATSVTVLPDTVQTAAVVEAKPTGNPELAVAIRATGAVSIGILPNAPNMIVCDAGEDP